MARRIHSAASNQPGITMKPFEIFRAGKQTSSAGKTIEFGEDELQAAAAAYDPAIHEAPIVVGHPKENGPAYGWVKAISFADGKMVADPIQVDEAFAEMVAAGRFKKRSASFYTPDSPHNPKPGVFYLRHVGFLGAQPPAVKGLKDVAFADADEGVVEFADAALLSGLFRRMREFFISKFSIDDANSVLPDWLISELEAEARADVEKTAAPMPAFTEGDLNMDFKEQFEAEKARADKAEADLKAQAENFSEREKAIAERETAIARGEVESQVDALVKAGKVLPAQKAATVDFAMSLNSVDLTLDFKEGEETKKVSQRDAYLKQIAAGPKLVEYSELAPADGGAPAPIPTVAASNKTLLDQVAGKAGKKAKA